MKKFPFLLLDAGPIIKLFSLGIWDSFIQKCDVTICRTVVNEAMWASQEFEDVRIDIEQYEQQGLISIKDVDYSVVKNFYDKFNPLYRESIHDGEKETIAFLYNSPENWLVCSADGVVFRILGFLGRAEQGISLEEILEQIGLSRKLEWKYTKKFRKRYTRIGQIDSIQNKGLV
jgi:hypothetical protein